MAPRPVGPPVGAQPLLAAKVTLPPDRGRTITRPRLHELLRGGQEARLTVVVAPAGWGKTTLLMAWAHDQQETRQIAWLSLDGADDEPVRFWFYVLSALETVAPDLVRGALGALAGQGLDPVTAALPALIDALTSAEDRYVLVLEDYHVITDPDVHAGVEYLLVHAPPSLRVVLSARHDPLLPLARLRARGELVELRTADLRCTDVEAIALMRGSGAPEAALAAPVIDRVEGWPAGLHLTALIMSRRDGPATTIHGDQRAILDFFVTEVMPMLDPAARGLLVRCSVLERLHGPLCDAVLGTSGSAAVLDRLERADLFVNAVDPSRRWYRCHQLFRDVLRRELDQSAPGAAAGLLDRAAQWYLAEDHRTEALEAWIAAGDRHTASRELDPRWFFDRGAAGGLLRFGNLLADQCEGRAQMCVWLAHAAAVSGCHPSTIRAWLDRAESGIAAEAPAPEGWRSLRSFADVMWAAYATIGDPETSMAHAQRAVELEDDPRRWGWVHARFALAVALRGIGELDEAAALLDQAWAAPGRADMPIVAMLQTAGEFMLVLVAQDDLCRAHAVFTEVAPMVADVEAAWGPGAAAAVARIRLARARTTMAEHGSRAALPELDRAVRLAEIWGGPNITVLALASQATARWDTDDRDGARRSLDRARDSARTRPPRPYTVAELDDLDARLGRRRVRDAHLRGVLSENLTDRELSVLRALSGPLSARQIGAELHLSINTVKGYTKSLYRKLDVDTRADAVRRGRDLGLT